MEFTTDGKVEGGNLCGFARRCQLHAEGRASQEDLGRKEGKLRKEGRKEGRKVKEGRKGLGRKERFRKEGKVQEGRKGLGRKERFRKEGKV
jgi:hypothetical protein